MKYDLFVNQKAIMEHGFDIDVVDAVILDYCLSYAKSGNCRTLVDGELTYYWFEHKNICDQLPILKVKKDTMYRRMKNLCELSFLKAHPENKQKNQSWYAIDKNTYLIESTIGKKSDGTNKPVSERAQNQPEPSEKNPKVGQSKGGPSEKNPMPIGEKSEGPSENNPMYNNISNKGNKINTLSSRARVKGYAQKRKAYRSARKRKRKPPGIPRIPPKPSIDRTDPFVYRSASEKTNVPFSRWFLAYQKRINEDRCRMAWLDLTDEERELAMDHTPKYVKVTPDKWARKDPLNYLELKSFHDEIIERRSTPVPQADQQQPVIKTKYKKARPD